MKLDLIEVISRTLELNSFEATFNVPGYGGTEVYDSLSRNRKIKTFINLNEEPAFSISYGVSSNGKRSALLIKSQGFTKAMNAITSSLSTDSVSANLIFVFDDTEGRSSDNILPTKKIVKSSEIPFQILGKNPSREIVLAIEKSEKLKLPVAIIVDCKKLKNEFEDKIEKAKKNKIKLPAFTERLACPVLTKYQRQKLSNKLSGKAQKMSSPKIKDIKKVLPEKLLKEFLRYENFMNIFKKHRPSFVSGDAGTSALFAFQPFKCVDTCTYMGGSPGMAMGAMIAGIKDAVSITGDFSFLAAGILGFNEAVLHNIPLKIIIFNNGKAHATGGQELNPILLESFCKSNMDTITRINLNSKKEPELEPLLENFLKKSTLSILVLDI
jgi:TPP-dependent indolepyruvate ferredoxin oxidoreductase alpha subunit